MYNIIYRMWGFYNIVLITAVIILILVLTYIGVKMYHQHKTAVYPPVVSACPDYWQQTADGTSCIVPDATGKNKGTSSATTNIPGVSYNSTTGQTNLNFKDQRWRTTQSAICAQKSWANQNGIIWDGVSNYNGNC